jgi:2-hydroxychromene-2-carboxylate isomerase
LAIFNKTLLSLKIKWLHSQFRKKILIFRYVLLGRFFGRNAKVDVYLALNDPHSFMLVQMLARLESQYDAQFSIFFVMGALPGTTIAPELQQQWAIRDANLIAEQYQLVKVDNEPSLVLLATGQQAWQLQKSNLKNAEQIFLQTWGNTFQQHYQTSTPTITHQVKNQARLQDKGHYSAAVLFFAGEWFTGVDRLFHFETALCELGLLTSITQKFSVDAEASRDLANFEYDFLPTSSKLNIELQQLEVFLSLRSPYSYLGFVQASALAEQYQLELIIKPVLPLLMRGASIPVVKQKYIYLDALREAKKLDIEFNGFIDPLGDGVINVYTMFAWAEQQGKAREYMLACFRAVYVDNIDLSTVENVDKIVNDLDLDSEKAHAYQAEHDWQQWADCNQQALTKLEFWGVPCFKFQNSRYWGQDRIHFLEKEIKLSLSIN